MQATHAAFMSQGEAAGAGGVMTFLHKRWADRGQTEVLPIVPGRILLTATRSDEFVLVVVGVHNFGITTQDIRKLNAELSNFDLDDARTLVVMIGDWNFCEETTRRCALPLTV